MCEGYFTAMSEFKKSGKSTYFCKSVFKKGGGRGERTNLPVLKCYAIQSKEGDSTEAYADKYKFKRLEHGSSMDVQQKEHKER